VDARKPFVGPAGRIFNAILRSANLDRDRYHVTNVFDRKADDNDCAEFMADAGYVAESSARLVEEIAAFKPNVIVPLGATALWAFTGSEAIKLYRGAVTKATRVVPGVKLLPTYHPAAVLRKYQLMPVVTKDFIKAALESKSKAITFPRVRMLVEPTLAELRQWRDWGLATDLLSTDIETGWGHITNIGFAPSAELAFNVPFVDLRKPNKSYWGSPEYELEARLIVKELLESPVPKLGQNYTYDAMWQLEKWGIFVRNYSREIRLLHHAIYPDMDKDLASMGATYTRMGQWKAWSASRQEKKDG
jgi:uracil-DNA glycosylase family 4